jgi:hypothetical protein
VESSTAVKSFMIQASILPSICSVKHVVDVKDRNLSEKYCI